MASKPILFNTEMVKAILDRRKMQTRRIVKSKYFLQWTGEDGFTDEYIKDPENCWINVAPYQPGDILWVRETWLKADDGYYYKADIEAPSESEDLRKAYGYKWKPSIHMPRKAARIFLRVTNVRVERLQEITEEDAIKEGTPYKICGGWHPTFNDPDSGGHEPDFINGFSKLWNSIYAAPKAIKNRDGEIMYYESYPWEDIQETREHKGKPWYVHGNPWVWVYEFERVSEDGSSKD